MNLLIFFFQWRQSHLGSEKIYLKNIGKMLDLFKSYRLVTLSD